MKKKKLLEKQVAKLDAKRANLYQQKMMLDGGVKDRDVVTSMQAATNAMGQLQNGMDKDALADMMGDIQGQANHADEIENVLGTRVGMEEFEEDALLEELRAMKM